MFGDLNRVELLGNITQEPELKYTQGGSAVMNLSIATNRRIKKGEEWVDETDFHNLVIWGNLATNLAARIHKGTRIYVAGVLRQRSWEGEDGKKNYRTEVHVSNNQDVILIARYEGARDGAAASTGGDFASEAGPRKSSGGASPVPSNNNSTVEIDPDDLPF
jgi:single-strand DNA-binding protein